jgi:hypothetical protein
MRMDQDFEQMDCFMVRRRVGTLVAGLLALLVTGTALAGAVSQPPGANLTLGDVTHGMRVQSASSNPAAAAADVYRGGQQSTRGTVISGAAGLEYGNVQELFDFYDQLTQAFEPSEPGTGPPPPGQDPGDKPDDGINIGDILDLIEPDLGETIDAIAREVAFQTALLAFISVEGYGKAWLSADAPFVLGTEYLGGAWTFGVGWSGSSKAYGAAEPIQFDEDEALRRLADWIDTLPINRPAQLPISDQVIITPDESAVFLLVDNDSSLVTKSTQTTELNLGYSRPAWSTDAGTLFLGAEARLYLKQLSRLSARFGDITDTKELFEAIRDADFRSDEGLGIDLGALWVGSNFQIGAQVTNINEPEFVFPDVNLAPYRSERLIRFLETDKTYRMDRQLKLEGSVFSEDRLWSMHIGIDVDPATDPMGDRFQWATLSAGFQTDSWWLPSARIGYRQNLAGTELGYVAIGLTAFKIVNIDIASALDTVKIDGQKLPQGLMASIGFQIVW